MTNVVGSIEEFNQMSSSYHQKAGELGQLKAYLDRQIKSSVWQGKAANRFREEWLTHQRNMTNLETLLEELSKELRDRATALQSFEGAR